MQLAMKAMKAMSQTICIKREHKTIIFRNFAVASSLEMEQMLLNKARNMAAMSIRLSDEVC